LSMERNPLSASRSSQEGGFWEAMQEQYNRNHGNSRYCRDGACPVSTMAAPKTSSLPLSQEASELKIGNIIEHERFGRGTVMAIEQSGNDKRAFVDFDSAGRKQLLLKFAKFRIVE